MVIMADHVDHEDLIQLMENVDHMDNPVMEDMDQRNHPLMNIWIIMITIH